MMNPRLMKAIAGVSLSFCPLTIRVSAQEPQAEAKFRAQTSNVIIDTIVTDHKGHPMLGLTADDFTLTEDGVPQKVLSVIPPESAGLSSAGTELAGKTPTGPDQNPKPAAPRSHLITVVLDLADNRPMNIRKSCETVLRYLEKSLSPNDFVAIYYIDRSLHLALSFTNDMKKAQDTVKKLEERLASSPFGGADRQSIQAQINDLYSIAHPGAQYGVAADSQAVSAGPGNTNPGLGDALIASHEIDTLRSYMNTMNTFQAKTIFVALRAICLSYRDIPGRKSVILFSEGFLYSEDARPAMEAVADAANRANVSFYVIDPVGLEIQGGGILGKSGNTAESQMAQIALEGAGSRGGQSKFDRIRSVGDQSRNEQLERLAYTTGGLMVKNTNDLLPAFTRVLDDARDFYTLVYEPANKNFDGRFRKIKVETRAHGVNLRYRQGYWAIQRTQAVAMTPSAAQLISGLQSGSVKATLAPGVRAELLLAPDGHYSVPVSVSLPGAKIPLEREGDSSGATLELVLVARDADGKIVAVYQRDWRLQLDKKQREEFEKQTIVVQGRIPVPSLERLTVEAIMQTGTTLAASGTTIAVTDVAPSKPAMTSILLTDRVEPNKCTSDSDPLCFHDVRLSLPASNRFSPKQRMILYFAASGPSLDPQTQKPRVGVGITLRSGDSAIQSPAAENVQALPGPTADSVWVLAEYDLRTLHSGTYTVRATVADMVQKSSQAQQAQFVIE